MSYLVLNRKSKRDCNKQLPYFQIFYNQQPESLRATRLKHKDFPSETNIFVANEAVSNQMCVLPQTFNENLENQTSYLSGDNINKNNDDVNVIADTKLPEDGILQTPITKQFNNMENGKFLFFIIYK